jgi:non-lysosomal glucosylceramidase
MIPYNDEELFAVGPRQTYRGRQLDEIAFPLGGIGTGSISLGGWGQLRDCEIFNRPHKGLQFQMTFFTLYARRGDEEPVTRVLQGPVGGFLTANGSGVDRATGAGLPHMRSCEFTGEFPLARLDFADPRMPLEVSLEAYNPFLPLNPDDSGLPIAIFLVHLHNPSDRPVKAVLFANLENRLGHPEVGQGVIEYREGEHRGCAGALAGLVMSTKKHAPDSPHYGTLALATPWRDLNVQTHWFRGAWFDSLQRFWDAASEGELPEERAPAEAGEKSTDVGSIGLRATLAPGERVTLPVTIAWHVPNFEKYWNHAHPSWDNFYGTQFADAWAVAEYAEKHRERLEGETRRFKETLFASTLPASVLDAVSSQISILKTTTCLRLTDGTFYGWEGCNPNAGCCEGTCTHVWNYAQALPFLFPTLEQSIRDSDYAYNQTDEGHMTFRMPLPLGVIGSGSFHPAADGQMGGIMKVYREWQFSGDDAWLREIWPQVKRALEYAWKYWDADRDGVMEGVQHNTYDIEFYGPNTMMGSFYLGALRAGEEMARHLGDASAAEEYRRVFESGRRWMDEHLFNGEFYRQEVRGEAAQHASHAAAISIGGQDADPKKGWPKYQYGDGCLSDQMIGQWMARIVGLGDLFAPEKVRETMAAIFRYNWKPDFWEHANAQRIYALNDEAGLLLCSWPRGGRPALPFVYSDEVWCGIEYQVASHLIYEGLVREGLAIVKGVRDRHDGTRRNPWNEFECGNHYARSMASYAVLLALSGYQYSAPEGRLAFAPRVHADDFACFFTTATGWGLYRQRPGEASLEVRAGHVTLRSLESPAIEKSTQAWHDGQLLKARIAGTAVMFPETLRVAAGQTLDLRLP